jgi:hypothetical protein
LPPAAKSSLKQHFSNWSVPGNEQADTAVTDEGPFVCSNINGMWCRHD